MRKWLSALSSIASLAVVPATPVVASAAPTSCTDYEVCNCEVPCDEVCYMGTIGHRFPSTCGQDGYWCSERTTCNGVADRASATQETQSQQDASGDVCTEPVQQASTAKS